VIRVRLPEADPIVVVGVANWLTSHPDIAVAPAISESPADVFVAVAGLVDKVFFGSLGETARRIGAVVVLVLDNMPDDALAAAAQAQVVSLLSRATTDRDGLVTAVIAASQDRAPGMVTGEESLVGQLGEALDEVRAAVNYHPIAVLELRDVKLLDLVARGWNTHQIAAELSLSHRTVVNRMQAVVKKCGARNRSEAVAQAVRAGLV
jgi:DNA-binding NarL/FixJ family response regulator